MTALVPDRYALAFRLYPYARSPDQDAAAPGAPQGGDRGRRAHRSGHGAGPWAARACRWWCWTTTKARGWAAARLCFAKRTLEICDRLGAAGPMLDKGVQWNVGKVFRDDRLLYEFNLSPEGGHAFPAFINLQQPYFEKFLHDAIVQAQAEGAPIELRGKQPGRCGHASGGPCARWTSLTPDGPYQARGRLADRLRRCAQPPARDAGAELRRAGCSRTTS